MEVAGSFRYASGFVDRGVLSDERFERLGKAVEDAGWRELVVQESDDRIGVTFVLPASDSSEAQELGEQLMSRVVGASWWGASRAWRA